MYIQKTLRAYHDEYYPVACHKFPFTAPDVHKENTAARIKRSSQPNDGATVATAAAAAAGMSNGVGDLVVRGTPAPRTSGKT